MHTKQENTTVLINTRRWKRWENADCVLGRHMDLWSLGLAPDKKIVWRNYRLVLEISHQVEHPENEKKVERNKVMMTLNARNNDKKKWKRIILCRNSSW